jgi:hypothetical protein
MSFVTLHASILVAVVLALVMGVGALVKPSLVTRQFEIVALTAAARNEVRAVYGGFGIAMAVMFGLALVDPRLRTGICLTAAASLAGMAGGRLLSAGVDRTLGRAPLAYLCLEAVLAGLLFYAA